MTERRTFIKGSAAVAAALVVGPHMLSAAEMENDYTNIIYTSANPGRWSGKEGIHAPVVTASGQSVQLETKHPMSEKHYIVRHTLVLDDGTYIGSKVFFPVDKPVSEYELPAGFKGKVYATSFCNLHDFWLTEFSV